MNVFSYYFYIIGAVGLFAVVALFLYGYELYMIAEVERKGKPAKGKITGKYKRASKNLVVYYIEVEYSTALRTINTKYKVKRAAWDKAKEGQTVDLIYLESNPKHVHQPELVGETWNMMALIGAKYVVLFVAVAGFYLIQSQNPNFLSNLLFAPYNDGSDNGSTNDVGGHHNAASSDQNGVTTDENSAGSSDDNSSDDATSSDEGDTENAVSEDSPGDDNSGDENIENGYNQNNAEDEGQTTEIGR